MPIVDSSQESSFRAMTDLTEQDLIDDLDLVEPIAIIGFSLKFPQDATSPEAFWDMMAAKRDGMTEFPSERINIDSFYHPDNARRNAFPVRGGHFIEEDLAAFDAKFFSITPAEAAAMDPAQRILLETTFRALENSGIPLERLRGSDTAVYTGCFSNDYLLQLLKDPEQLPTYAATGASLSMLANRLSWFFDLSGPSVNFDSACSSSAMALDQACRTLQSGQSSMALVAGCNLSYSPEYTNILSNMNFLSPESRCFTFDNRADGYSRGEGIGVVVLKKLSQALQDQDTIRALIRSTGCNQDGHTAGITQPSSKAQERLMKEVYSRAGLSMKKTRFFEAHGTGTPIGDPTEISAIAGAFGRYRTPKEPLYVGAVKTNIGHLEGASGIAGLIKTILILETGYILPNTNFHEINTKINLEGSNIKLPLSCTPWPCKGLRRASINSFGFGGSNCHVVLDDAFHYITQHGLTGNLRTAPNPSQLAPSYHTPHLHVGSASCRSDDTSSFLTPKILVWSASDQMSLQEMILRYQNHCSNLPDSILKSESYVHNLAYTLDSHRSSLKWKSYVVLESSTELKDLAKTASRPVANRKLSPSIAFIFTGQGAQWHAMGRELFTYPVFEQAIQDSQGILKKLKCPWSIRGNFPLTWLAFT
jgi:acyl transferase domain-containing protein